MIREITDNVSKVQFSSIKWVKKSAKCIYFVKLLWSKLIFFSYLELFYQHNPPKIFNLSIKIEGLI